MQKKASVSGVLVLVLVLFAGCGKIDERVMATPSVRQSDPNRLFILSDFAAKALYTQDADKKWYQSPSDSLTATVQWHAMLTSVTTKVARCEISINLRDGDDFLLGQINYTHRDDLEPKKASPISGELEVKLGVVRHLKSIEVLVTPLPSLAEVEAERQRYAQELMQEQRARWAAEREAEAAEKQQKEAQIKAEQLAQAEKQAQWQAAQRAEKLKWDSLEVGMSKEQVLEILGRPSELTNSWWYYDLNRQKWVHFEFIPSRLTGWKY